MNAPKAANQDQRILRVLADKLAPWAANQRTPWIVATDRRRKLNLCEGVRMAPRALPGKVATTGGPRRYRNASLVAKSWPEAHLSAAKNPKLACVTAGCADLQFYDYELRLPERTFLFIPSDIPQPDGSLIHISPGNPQGFCDICWVQPVGDKLHFWLCRCEGEKHFPLQWSNVIFLNQRLNLYMQLLHEEVVMESKTPSLTSHLLQLLILGLQREAAAQSYLQLVHDENPAWRLQNSKDPIVQAQEYVDAHFSSDITLESVARMVGMSRSLFAQRFKQQTGRTLGGFLTARRLREAKNLLRQSEWTVSTISEFVGFHSEAHFYNLFRKSENCSPGEFRNASPAQAGE